MKKILALVLALAMVATFAACGGAETSSPAPSSSAPATETKTAEYKLGMGVSVSLDSSADATAEKNATAQCDATVATVVLDKDGKIVAADLDCAQTKVQIKDGKIVDIDKVDLRTKKEKKEDYNMKGFSPIGKEWYEQAAAYAEKMVGKTAADIEAIETEVKDGHNVAVDADLYAACTMDITAFKAAFIAACKDEQAKTFTAAEGFKLGLDIDTAVNESADATADTEAVAKLYSDFAATVVVDGKVVAAVLDAIQPSVTVTDDNKIGTKSFTNTKRGLKADYGMAAAVNYGMDWNADGVVKEWFEQSKALTDYVVGMTADEVKAIKTQEVEGHGYIIPAVEDLLTAGCTIQISAYQAVLANAIAAAK